MSICEDVVIQSRNKGIDECEVIFVRKKITTVRITESEITEIKQNQENELGIRTIHQKKISSAKTTNTNEPAKILEQALATAKFSQPKNFWKSLPSDRKNRVNINGLYDEKLAKISGTQASEIAQTMINSSQHKSVSNISGSLNIVSENFEIANTSGLYLSDNATYISATINADSDFGTLPVSGIGQQSCRTLKDFVPEKVGEDSSQMCINSINPQKCQDGTYSIIFEPYSVGEILAFVFASNFNLKTYSEKRSCFSDKVGQKIATDNFTLLDDPHFEEGVGSKNFDDEGVSTEKIPLIENGVFSNTYSDSLEAFREGLESTGNAIRQGSPMGRSVQPIPTPAPHNLRITGKNKVSTDEIIANTKHGLLIGRLWYTYAVNPTRGDFSCTARSGVRIIEDGKIKSPGKPVRIVHNLPILLQNISYIGNDEKNVLQWASLPSIAPTVMADGIKVTPI